MHDQLGVYQLAVQQGAFAEVAGPDARPGGAELVYLRTLRRPGQLSQGVPAGLARRRAPPVAAGRRPAGRGGGRPDLGARPAGRGRGHHPGRAARGPDRCRLPLLPVPRQLPGPVGGSAGGRMTVHAFHPPASTARFRDPADLVEALGIPFSVQQLAAITAPLEPGVIIAGAGSGKTTVMAARVVWLVGTGAVRPEEVLGLTFTRKAAAELSQRVRGGARTGGRGRRPGGRRVRRAAGHDLRRVRGPAGRRARTAAGVRGRPDHDQRGHPVPARLTGGQGRGGTVRVLVPAPTGLGDRTGAQTRLRPPAAPGRGRAPRPARPRPAAGLGVGSAQQPRQRLRRRPQGHGGHPGTSRTGQPGPGLPGAEAAARSGRVRRPDGHRRPAGHRGAADVGGVALDVQGRAARRIPGHLGRAGGDAARTVLGDAPRATASATR